MEIQFIGVLYVAKKFLDQTEVRHKQCPVYSFTLATKKSVVATMNTSAKPRKDTLTATSTQAS